MTEIVYEVRLKVRGDASDVQLVDETVLMQAFLSSARSAEADDDYTVAIIGVEVERIR